MPGRGRPQKLAEELDDLRLQSIELGERVVYLSPELVGTEAHLFSTTTGSPRRCGKSVPASIVSPWPGSPTPTPDATSP